MSNARELSDLVSAAPSTDASFDGGTLYIDRTNNRVGIGTSSPATALDVNGNIVIADSGTIGSASATSAITIDNSGNVGIGTTQNDFSKLELKTGVYGANQSEDGVVLKLQTSEGGNAFSGGLTIQTNSGGSPTVSLVSTDDPNTRTFQPFIESGATGANQYTKFLTAGTERMRIDSSGNVIIPSAEITGGTIDGVTLGTSTISTNVRKTLVADYNAVVATNTPTTVYDATNDPVGSMYLVSMSGVGYYSGYHSYAIVVKHSASSLSMTPSAFSSSPISVSGVLIKGQQLSGSSNYLASKIVILN